MLRSILLLPLLWLLPLMPLQAAQGDIFDTTFGDLTEELETARADGKKGVFLFFHMEDCPFCQYMESRVFTQPEVKARLREYFMVFPIDTQGDIEVTTFKGEVTTQKAFALNDLRVRATPVLAFFDLEGNQIFKFTGKTAGPEEFLQMIDYVAGGHYQQLPFSRYKRGRM
jgi:thioredoxin-related protein